MITERSELSIDNGSPPAASMARATVAMAMGIQMVQRKLYIQARNLDSDTGKRLDFESSGKNWRRRQTKWRSWYPYGWMWTGTRSSSEIPSPGTFMIAQYPQICLRRNL